MTSLTPQRTAAFSAGRAAVLLACLVPLLAACAGAAAQVRLPPKTTAQAVADPAARPLTAQQQVVAAYTGYTAAMSAAFDSRDAAAVRQLLGPYLDTATIKNAIRASARRGRRTR